jgi:hypothetical protein
MRFVHWLNCSGFLRFDRGTSVWARHLTILRF